MATGATCARASASKPRRIDEKFGLAACRHDGEGEHDGIVRDVAAANVEKPADRVGQRQNGGALAVALEPRLKLCDLFSGRLAGERERLGNDGAGGWLRLLLAPQRIDRILRQGLKLDALRRERRFEAAYLSGGVIPGVESDRLAFAERGRQPLGEFWRAAAARLQRCWYPFRRRPARCSGRP